MFYEKCLLSNNICQEFPRPGVYSQGAQSLMVDVAVQIQIIMK